MESQSGSYEAAADAVEMPASGQSAVDLRALPGFSFVHRQSTVEPTLQDGSDQILSPRTAAKKRPVPPGSQVFQASMSKSRWRYNGQYYSRIESTSEQSGSQEDPAS
ncbi:hypothetical protein BOX15_Mlig008349g2 [Macrostomum lignano]|uniref:Uncharacterized protein n=1 Tax=Macrostomum lignano TaxID=282301 RepID=A0A267DNC5_9PLAT|nr:hypothetical protein BOX15_Mlig008349g5 [Macrostomum lignano]PAA52319.1 hypothetical protein BOX15_Mlig008349g4 [Macrostomum lignano]PAA55261.1 hypothetical protein BOX15_Mlig008349g3 [Macrostomum lignano]PAA60691.1 hypothetical protein BOX15_Mlig008349g1 [Macrostomum lignano]PAA86526.1 hypothetical protein BOX15_Mlig008349g2 [Macrostomum lignano]